jgi:glucose/galactose transporter
MAAALVGLAVMVRFSALPEIEVEQEDQNQLIVLENKTSIVQFPHLILGAIALFLYVGIEVIAGDTIGTFGQSQGIPLSEAKNFTSFTLSAMVIGYIIGIIAIPKYLSQPTALAGSAVVGILFTIIAINTSGYTSVLFIALLGLANALVWPAIWPLAIDGLGKFTKTGSALLIMAIAGGALLPLIYGSLADMATIGQQKAYYLMVPCYAFIFFYALRGYKTR